MPEDDFEEISRLYETGQMSRRRFIGRMVAGGASLTAALAIVNATGTAAFAGGGDRRRPDGHYGKAPCHYGDAPGHYGKAPGHYGEPPRHREDDRHDDKRGGKRRKSRGRRR